MIIPKTVPRIQDTSEVKIGDYIFTNDILGVDSTTIEKHGIKFLDWLTKCRYKIDTIEGEKYCRIQNSNGVILSSRLIIRGFIHEKEVLKHFKPKGHPRTDMFKNTSK